MLDVLFDIVGVSFLSVCNILVWSILLNKKVDFKNINTYISFIVLALVSMFVYNNLLRFTIVAVLMIILIKFLFKQNLKIAVLTAAYTQILNFISEIIFSLLALFVFRIDFEVENISKFLTLFADIFVSISTVLIVKIKFVRGLYNTLSKIISKLNIKQILLGILPIVFIFNIYMDINYYKLSSIWAFILNYFTIYVIVIIVLVLAKKENEYAKIYDKYNTTLNSLKEYEDILDRYRISNHENKNQLLTIRNMIPKTNKKTINYIDTIIENKLKDDDKVMFEASKIPAGGLRGLIYSKVLLMKNKDIDYELEISNEIKTVDLINKIDDQTMLDICKIIGVYLDNSIQEVESLKEKYINVEMFIENHSLLISISNNYNGKIELDKLENRGYTSKGKGHGYGLALAKKIIENNKKLSNEKSISRDVFAQTLKIKM